MDGEREQRAERYGEGDQTERGQRHDDSHKKHAADQHHPGGGQRRQREQHDGEHEDAGSGKRPRATLPQQSLGILPSALLGYPTFTERQEASRSSSLRNHAIVRIRPASGATFGVQPNTRSAFSIFGRRRSGSSWRLGS